MVYYSLVMNFDDEFEPWIQVKDMNDIYDGCARYFFDRYCHHIRHSRNSLEACMIDDGIEDAYNMIKKRMYNFTIKYSHSNVNTPDHYDDGISIYDKGILNILDKLIEDNQNKMIGN